MTDGRTGRLSSGGVASQPLTPVAFLDLVAEGRAPSVVVFAGEEGFLAEEGIDALSAALFPGGAPPGAVVALDAASPDDAERVPAALDEVRTGSLFGPGKLVVVRNLGEKGAADDGDGEGGEPEPAPDAPAAPGAKTPRKPSPITALVKAAMASPVANAVLVIASRKAAKGKGSVSTDAILKTGAALVDCRRLYDTGGPWARDAAPWDTEVSRWLVRRARALHRKAMDPTVAHALSMRIGAGLSSLAQALESLSAYVGERPEITGADVAASVGERREDPGWTFGDAVLDRDLDKALGLLAGAFDRGITDAKGRVATKPDGIYAMLEATLHAAYRRLMAVSEAAARGQNPASLPSLAGLPPFAVERVLRQASRRDPADLLARHGAFVDASAGVRGGGVPPRLALERLVIALAG